MLTAGPTGPAAAVQTGRPAGHLLSLPDTGWALWRTTGLRSAGFPAAGVLRLADEAAAAAADAWQPVNGRIHHAPPELAAAMAAAAARAQARGVRSMVGFNYRRVPALALARELIASDRVGEIRHVRASYLQDWLADPAFPLTWRLQQGAPVGLLVGEPVALGRGLRRRPVPAAQRGQHRPQRQVERVRGGAPGLRVRRAHERVADHAHAQGWAFGGVRGGGCHGGS